MKSSHGLKWQLPKERSDRPSVQLTLNSEKCDTFIRKFQLQIIATIAIVTSLWLLYLNRNLWFYGDDFSFIFDRYFQAKDGNFVDAVLRPHNEHPAVLPSLTYLAIESVFGLDHYWLFLVPVLTMHAVIVMCVGRLLSRMLGSPLLVLAGTCVTAFLSAGNENLFWGFQFGFIGAIAFGLFHLVLIYDRQEIGWQDYLGSFLAVCAVTTQGTGLTALFVIGLYLALSKRWKALVIALLPAVTVFATWRLSFGSTENHSKPTKYQLLELHKYIWKGLTTAGDGIFHLTGIATILLASIVAFISLRYKRNTTYNLIIALLSATVFFYTVNGIGRIHFGIDQAGVSRYAYVGVTLLVIPFFFLVDSLLNSRQSLRYVAALICIWTVVVGGMEFVQHSRFREQSDQERFSNMSSAIELSYTYDVRLDALPSPTLDSNVSVAKLLRAEEQGLWPTKNYRKKNLIDTANRVSLTLVPSAAIDVVPTHKITGYINTSPPTVKNDCIDLQPLSSPQIIISPNGDEPLSLTARFGSTLGVMLQTNKGLRSVEVQHELLAGQTYAITGWLSETDLVLNLPNNSPVTICGVQVL